jgi:hypothetical protein
VPTAASRRRSRFGLDLAVVRENSIRQESVHPSLGSRLTDHSIVALLVELGLHRVKELTIEDCGLLAGKYFAFEHNLADVEPIAEKMGKGASGEWDSEAAGFEPLHFGKSDPLLSIMACDFLWE